MIGLLPSQRGELRALLRCFGPASEDRVSCTPNKSIRSCVMMPAWTSVDRWDVEYTVLIVFSFLEANRVIVVGDDAISSAKYEVLSFSQCKSRTKGLIITKCRYLKKLSAASNELLGLDYLSWKLLSLNHDTCCRLLFIARMTSWRFTRDAQSFASFSS